MSKGNSGLFKKTVGSKIVPVKPKEPDFYVGPNGGALLSEYKEWIGVSRRERLMKKVKSEKMKNAVDYLYRRGSFIGDGGTASALKFESATGLGIGKSGNTHLKKANDFIKHLKKLENDISLSKGERKLARKFKVKLLKAVGGFKK